MATMGHLRPALKANYPSILGACGPAKNRAAACMLADTIAAMFFKEEASERALKAAIDADIIILDLSFAEVGNVAWKKVVLSGADEELTKRALEKCMSFIFEACDVVRFQDLALDAYEISMETKTTFYDSLFIALAEKEQVPLLTLDRRMYDRAKGKVNMKWI